MMAAVVPALLDPDEPPWLAEGGLDCVCVVGAVG
jgi:hypothetical protein